jgi:hypothetical protein
VQFFVHRGISWGTTPEGWVLACSADQGAYSLTGVRRPTKMFAMDAIALFTLDPYEILNKLTNL